MAYLSTVFWMQNDLIYIIKSRFLSVLTTITSRSSEKNNHYGNKKTKNNLKRIRWKW